MKRSGSAVRGQVNYHAGQAAEDIVAHAYQRCGQTVAARRWRGPGGEIDLIARDGDAVVFIEVKKARTFDAAIQRLTRRQIDRICTSATAFVAGEPRGQLTDMRFDLALVNDAGEVRIVENAFGGA